MSVELDNVSYLEFIEFDDEKFGYYKRIGLAMKPDSGGLDDVMNWNYGKVKEAQMMYHDSQTVGEIPQIIAFCHDRELKVVSEMKWHEVFQYYNHITDEMKRVAEREQILSYEPDADQIEAGIDQIGEFGVMATIDTLAGGNILLYDDIEAKPYYLVFAKLHLESEKGRYMENLNRIKSRKKT